MKTYTIILKQSSVSGSTHWNIGVPDEVVPKIITDVEAGIRYLTFGIEAAFRWEEIVGYVYEGTFKDGKKV